MNMYLRINFCMVCMVLLMGTGLYGQSIRISGTVTDMMHGTTLPGVTILIQDTNIGVVTDSNGRYEITAPSDGVLVFSFIGMTTEYASIDGRTVINMAMAPLIETLQEIVVIGYGSISRRDLTGAVSVVNTNTFDNVQALSVANAMQGLASGVTIRANGAIGSEPIINIRGIGNISNNNPLFVVDDVIFAGGLRDLNVNDIESIQILKDASAAAIYGNRAANGVIIITTKRGRPGEPVLDFSWKSSFERLPSLNLMDTTEFFFYNNMAYANANRSPQNHFRYSTDWEREALQTGITNDYNLSVSGGSENSNYFISANYFSNEGTLKQTSLERVSIRVNTEGRRGIFTFGQNLGISNFSIIPFSGGNPITDIMRMQPNIPVHNEDNPGGFGYGDEARARTFGTNPIAIHNLINIKSANTRLRGNFFGEAQIFNFLKYRVNFGYETSFDEYRRLRRVGDFTLNLPFEPSHIHENKARYQSLLFDNLLTFDQIFGKHAINAVLGSSLQDEGFELIHGQTQDVFQTGGRYFDVIDAGTSNPMTGGFRWEIIRISYFGRFNYNFDDRYLLSATLRQDNTSQFARKNRTGYFPSISGGWRISEERFFGLNWVDDLKLRASYGELGNSAVGAFDYIPVLTTFPLAVFGPDYLLSGATQRELVNEDLRWETKKQTNIGLDVELLQNRFQLSADYYESVTEDVLVAFPILIATGNDGGNPWVNAGTLKNSGIDIDLSWREFRPNFRYSVSANFTTIRNRVIDLPYGDERIISGAAKTRVGHPMAMFYLIQTDGLFQSQEEVLAHTNSQGVVIQPTARPGDIRYVDFDDNGLISAAGDRQIVGSPWPKLEAGIAFDMAYKNIDFAINGFGAFGQKAYNGTRSLLDRFDDNTNYRRGINPWTPENTNTDFPRVIYADERNSRGDISRWIEDASFFKIRQITIGYTFQQDVVLRQMRSLRVGVSVQNPFTFTKYTGLDPEFANGNLLQFGVDGNSFPSPTIFLFSINAQI